MLNIKTLSEKIERKNNLIHEVLNNGLKTLNILRKEAQFLLSDLRKNMTYRHYPVKLQFKDKGDNEFELSIGDKALAFFMPNYVYAVGLRAGIFPSSYFYRKTTDEHRYCSIIYIYHFSRQALFNPSQADVGILLGRIFVNKEMDCMIEGKGEMAVFTPGDPKPVSNVLMRNLLLSATNFIIDTDIPPTPFEELAVIQADVFLNIVDQTQSSSQKRIGFQSRWESHTE